MGHDEMDWGDMEILLDFIALERGEGIDQNAWKG
jgi:hypothetical protein